MSERPRKVTARLSSSSAAQCPLCRCDLAAEAIAAQACEGCGVQYHQDCAEELGGCSTAGCARMGEAPADPAAASERERRRVVLTADHERLLQRFRAGRDALARDRWWTNVGMPLRAIALAGIAFGLWQVAVASGGGFERAGLAVSALLLGAVLLQVASILDRH